jgi:putative Mg2+ transporter-C (MgtC) family protein
MQLGMDPPVREALQLLMALGLGAVIGLERRLRGHPAGIHTNSLVALGSAAFTISGLTLGGDAVVRLSHGRAGSGRSAAAGLLGGIGGAAHQYRAALRRA